jgi:hypothetical protein
LSDNKMVLHPVDPWAILQDPSFLLDKLRELGLIGSSFNYLGELHHKEGPRFRELVAFKAPGGPGRERDFHVALLETTADATFLGAANARAPQCPVCRSPFADWRTQLVEWQRDRHGYGWACRKCARMLEIQQLDWLGTGGVARYSLDIWGIHEGEALPSSELLRFLHRQTFKDWTYFYYRL